MSLEWRRRWENCERKRLVGEWSWNGVVCGCRCRGRRRRRCRRGCRGCRGCCCCGVLQIDG